MISCTVFFKVYLAQVAKLFKHDFEKQNLSELNSVNVFGLTARLNSLSSTIPLSCIVGTRAGKRFYEFQKSQAPNDCNASFFNEVVFIQAHGDENLEIAFTLTLPQELKYAAAVFLSLQLLLLFTLLWSARQSERDLHENEAKLGKLAAQVAHDVRSPLAALEVVLPDLSVLSEDKRLLVRSAIGRIQDIINHLLETYRKDKAPPQTKPQASQPNPTSTQLLSALVESLVSEKRLQYRARLGVEISTQLSQDSYGLFANINPLEIKRVLSNLINNAVESFEDKGVVLIKLFLKNSSDIMLEIRDNGKGIPPEILPKLTQKGQTFGKKQGHGLGLYHARKILEGCGGRLEIQSSVGKGTSVSLILPRAKAPAWFVVGLKIPQASHIVIVDDDATIHQIWERKFEDLPDIKVHHFSNPTELEKWYLENSNSTTLYLLDYEFSGSHSNGIQLIEKLNFPTSQAILVTSHYEEKKIQEYCEKHAVKLIPKGIVAYVPIMLLPNEEKNLLQVNV